MPYSSNSSFRKSSCPDVAQDDTKSPAQAGLDEEEENTQRLALEHISAASSNRPWSYQASR